MTCKMILNPFVKKLENVEHIQKFQIFRVCHSLTNRMIVWHVERE
jgi:hypothetical protein